MHLLVINCSPRVKENSNTEKITDAFCAGFCGSGHTVQRFNLCKRGSWGDIREAFNQSRNILMAVPLYVENVPGIMLEFLQTLTPKKDDSEKASISFILHGGFPEGSQLRCGEEYLQALPKMLGCEYKGTLIKGGTFAVSFMSLKQSVGLRDAYFEKGEEFAVNFCFNKEMASRFAAPEHFSAATRVIFTLLTPIQNITLQALAKSMGCKRSLKAKPYKNEVQY